MKSNMKKVAIIGAGLAGLSLARLLKDYSEVVVFEKSHNIGGRMSIKRSGQYHFDHGTQYFTVKTPEFMKFIQPMIDKAIIKSWNARFVEIKAKEIVNKRIWNDDYKHYVGIPDMNAIAKYLSKGLNIYLNTCLSSLIKSDDERWLLNDSNGNYLGSYDWLIFAIPSDQLKDLLPQTVGFYTKIKSIKMNACFSMMLGFNKEIDLGFDAALVHDEVLSWISVNSSKPDRNTPVCMLVNSANSWANKHIGDNCDQVIQKMYQRFRKLIKHSLVDLSYKNIHMCRYANIAKQNGPEYFIDLAQNISACGDWCIQGRVEYAFTSAYKLAKQIKREIINE